MPLSTLRRRGAPVSILTLLSFCSSLLPATRAWAGEAREQAPVAAAVEVGSQEPASEAARAAAVRSVQGGGSTRDSQGANETRRALGSEGSSAFGLEEGAEVGESRADGDASSGAVARADGPGEAGDGLDFVALPTGADKSGVTSQAISVPKGSGSIDGMGESFSAQLSTGIATFSVPFALPAARGAAQPSLGLSYSSSGGHGLAGAGWSVGVPFIARETDRGLPGYDDRGGWHPNQDRFVFNGGQELVPICTIDAGGGCERALTSPKHDGAPVTESFPEGLEGWQYFRARVEGSFLRFFWAPDHRSWVVQDKSGVTMELGVPLDDPSYAEALEVSPERNDRIYKWHLTRQYDAQRLAGQPVNKVLYHYLQDGGAAYLSDIYATTPVSDPSTGDPGAFAQHTRLVYEARSDRTFSYRSGWELQQNLRLSRVDITSAPFDTTASSGRRMVRRYHLTYDPGYHVSLLQAVQVEGRCAESEAGAPEEDESGRLPEATGCGRLPAMVFDYEHVEGFDTRGEPAERQLEGFEAIDGRIQALSGSPPHSVDEQLTDLFDVNSDGLPDVLVTAPGLYGDGHAVFFNGPLGAVDTFGSDTSIGVSGGIDGANPTVIKLSNMNLVPLDLDGDGSINLLHMPRVKTYALYEPRKVSGMWRWLGRTVEEASRQNAKIDFGSDTLDIQVMDVNGDGLVDVVSTTGTEVQTFLSLGRYAGGDGQFGSAVWSSADRAVIDTDPLRTCVPWSAQPVRFSDPDIKVGDMNGDGLPDIVRVRRGDIRYWPGRGNGEWGTGPLGECPEGTFSENRAIAMETSPYYSDIEGNTLRLDDINGDGLDDLVQVRFTDVDVFLNVDGRSWTDRAIIENTPASPSYANRVRLVDVNGSGTRDILWGDGIDYKYIDLQGGKRPWVLTGVYNGLGKTTSIEYSTSAQEMLAAGGNGDDLCSNPEASDPWGDAWCRVMPTVTHLVKRVTESDDINEAGRGARSYVTEYEYRDPVFEGRQREFRGFQRARAIRLGDANSPTDITETQFLLGECQDETDDDTDDCSTPERWRDNPREALKGLPVVTEKYDASGKYLSTEITKYRLRHLYTGEDGRAVRQAVAVGTETHLYDTARFVPEATQATVPVAEVSYPSAALAPVDFVAASAEDALGPIEIGELVGGTPALATVPLRAASTVIRSASWSDYFGNQELATSHGCVAGCEDPWGYLSAQDETITKVTEAALVPGSESAWLWRTTHSYVEGSEDALRRSEQRVTYDDYGNPIETRAELWGSPGDLSGARSGGINASEASSAPTILVSAAVYDGFGNVEQSSGPNGRCAAQAWDNDFKQLVVTETIYTGGCGTGGLTTRAHYDRGLGAPVGVQDMNAQWTHVAYDSFGRTAAMWKPPPGGTPSDYGPSLAALDPNPDVAIEYYLAGTVIAEPAMTIPPEYSVIYTRTKDGPPGGSATTYMEAYAFVDGFGRTLATLTEGEGQDAGGADAWIVSGRLEHDAKGAVRRKYIEQYWAGAGADPLTFDINAPATSRYGSQRYDAFGRQVQTYDVDGTVTLQSVYHALSTDLYDAADLEPGPHQNTYASARKDGHGRAVITTERAHAGGAVEARHVVTEYLPTGEPRVITRRRGADAVTRWMQYDSLGRMVLNVEPNTTGDYQPPPPRGSAPGDPSSWPTAWRYAYNDAGDLVGTADARGCGVNFHYDGAGRLLLEDYIPCQPEHQGYTAPDYAGGTGMEVAYYYDALPGGLTPPIPVDFPVGRMVMVRDRGSELLTNVDARGRTVAVAKRLAKPAQLVGEALVVPGDFASRYAPRWYQRHFSYDQADREVAASTGAVTSDLQGQPDAAAASFPADHQSSVVTTTYTSRGTVGSVSGSYGTLVAAIDRTADGLVTRIQYGDAANTTTANDYDDRRRLRHTMTYRGPPTLWTSPGPTYTPAPTYTPDSSSPETFQMLLQDEDYTYDVVGNPTEIRDWRLEEEWPSGAKPVSRKVEYDDLYRVRRMDYQYAGGTDPWTSPFEHENTSSEIDARLAQPSPHIQFAERTKWQTFEYDWLGNQSATDDDAHGFYDRSLGEVTNGGAAKPYQLSTAQQPSGSLQTNYDATGNLTQLVVNRSGTCLGTGSCNQTFDYTWDEVGRLVRAQRRESGATVADLWYSYDAGDQRVLKTANADGAQRHTAYVFATLELRRASFEGTDFTRNDENEVPYLMANGVRLARVVSDSSAGTLPSVGGEAPHVFLELGDHLGSTSVVLDKATGELVERASYYGYGATESDYRPDRWAGFREDYRFTGKEEDVEVGLVYFGKRFLNPLLGRWVSPDPLAVHVPGEADFNLYAYVSGQALRSVDPVGLQDQDMANPGPYADSGAHRGTSGDGSLDYNPARAATPNGAGAPSNASVPSRANSAPASQGTYRPDASDPFDSSHLTPSNTILDNVAAGAGLAAAEAPDAVRLDGSGVSGGIPGGACPRGDSRCISGTGVQLAYVATVVGGALKSAGKAVGRFFGWGASKLWSRVAKAWAGLKDLKGMEGCFPAGTLVVTENGSERIEEVEAGEEIACLDTQSGEWDICRVARRLTHEYQGSIVELTIDEETIEATGNHPIWVVAGEGLEERPVPVDAGADAYDGEWYGRWVQAADVQVGDVVATVGGGEATVCGVAVTYGELEVFNLEVETHRTYAVGDTGVLVHNKGVYVGAGRKAAGGGAVLRGTNEAGQVTSRGSWRRGTEVGAWEGAEPGPTAGRLCPTCRKEVTVPPRSGQPRDWDINHDPPWTKREFPPDVTRKEVLDNYQDGTWLECPTCNRSAGNRR